MLDEAKDDEERKRILERIKFKEKDEKIRSMIHEPANKFKVKRSAAEKLDLLEFFDEYYKKCEA